ncbi:MAG: GDP-mannose 4,6-dehydratase [Gemmatimonadaceae bacterium]
MPTALVTGAAGFVGQWLCRELLERGWLTHGTALESPAVTTALTPEEVASVRWHPADVRHTDDLTRVIDASRPDAVFHLAGLAFIPAASADPAGVLEVNVVAAARLLGVIRERRAAGALDPTVLIVGSAEQYGRHDTSEMPLLECAEQRPHNRYAASKAAQEIVALEAFRADGVRVLCTRSFGHSGAGQAEEFLLPALVRRALGARTSGAAALPIGNTAPVRDYLHVRDVARAYVDLAVHGNPGDAYNVASGVGTSVRSLAERVLALSGVRAELREDPALIRAADVPVLVGDSTKLRAATGWAPCESVDTIIEDVIRAATR